MGLDPGTSPGRVGGCDLRCCLPHPPACQEASWRATRTPSSARSRRRGTRSPRASTCSASGPARSGSSTQARTSLQQRLADPKINYGLMARRRDHRPRGAAQALPLTRAAGGRARAGASAGAERCRPAPRRRRRPRRPAAARGSARRSAPRRSPPRPPAVAGEHARPPCRAPRRPRGPSPCSGTSRVGVFRPAEELDLQPELVGPEVGHRSRAGAARRGCRGPRSRPGRRRWSSARRGAGHRGPGRPRPRCRPPPTPPSALRPARWARRADRCRGRARSSPSQPSRGTPPIPTTAASAGPASRPPARRPRRGLRSR